MKLSVIIVNYNVKFYLEQCLRSVRKALEGIDAEVIVIDNHSRDGSVEYLSARFPDYTFISSNHNLGFARANNRAIEQSRGEYVLLLNPDTVVSETSLHAVLDFMDGHLRAGAAGVRMIKVDGSDALESRRGVPSPMTSFYKMSGLCRHFPQSRRFGKYYMSYLSWTEPAQIEIVSGAFCMLRRKALDEVGLLDEDYFMYGEDIDLSYRLLKGGWENWYVPVKILHYKGESTQKSSFRYVHVFYEAMLIFFRKHFGHLSFLLTCPVQLAIYAKAFLALLSMVLGKIRRSLGFVDSPFKSDPLYVFHVPPGHRILCETLVKRKGLRAEIYDVTEGGYDGHVAKWSEHKQYEVFDMAAFSYGDVFGFFSQTHSADVVMAMYYPEEGIVITDTDVLN
ncbi:MAG: glycosyltransferase family 2 protein [Prevotella sp.]